VARWLTTPWGLASLFGIALLLRLLVAPVTGDIYDIRYFRGWSTRLVTVGPRAFYRDFVADPPGYLLFLWPIGKLGQWLGQTPPSNSILKLPSMLADLGLAWVAAEFAVRTTPAAIARREVVRTAVAAAILFNPAVFFLSSVWGQVDTLGCLLLLLSLLVLFTGSGSFVRRLGGMALLGLAVAVKPQVAIAIPAVGFAVVWWTLGKRSAPRELLLGIGRAFVMGATFLLAWGATGLPFALSLPDTIHRYLAHTSINDFTGMWSYNLWGVLGPWKHDVQGDSVLLIGGIPAIYVGLVVFAVALAIVLARSWRLLRGGGSEPLVLLYTAAASSALGFALLTRMWERYLLVAVVCLAPLIFRKPLAWTFAGLSAAVFLGVYFHYVFDAQLGHFASLRVDPLYGWVFGGRQIDALQKQALSLAVLGALLWVGLRGWRSIREPAAAMVQSRTTQREARREVRDGSALRKARGFRDRARVVGSAVPEDSRAKLLPFSTVALAVAFNLWVLRTEILPVRQLNDGSVHQSMIQWALDRIHGGHLTLDGWFPALQLGSSLFHHYQSLSHTLAAYASLAIGPDRAYSGILYLLLATWPISVYLGARLLGWERWAAAGAALVSPLIVSIPGYGFEHESYTWRGLGVWSQLWGMWLLPLAWGFSWRAISGRSRSLAFGALFVGLTAACHFLTGFMALLVIPVWVLIKPSELLKRLARAAVVGIGALLIISWVVVPLLLDSSYSTVSRYLVGTFWFDSYGARKVFGWLFSGKLFDGSAPARLPVISILVAIGLVVCIARFRTDERARALIGALSLGLVLFSGRSTFGPLLDLIPGSGDIFFHRFITGIHLSGVLLAGVGVGWIAGLVERSVPAFTKLPQRAGVVVATVGIALLALAPAWTERARFDATGGEWLHIQREADTQEGANVDALITEAEGNGPGRMYGGASDGWGSSDTIYSVPIYSYLLSNNVDGVGFYLRTTSVSEDVEVLFDETNPDQYDMFNVRYLILPAGQKPLVPAKLMDTKGSHSLYEVPTTGYLQVVDALPAITADRANLAANVEAWMNSELPAEGRYPTVAFAGAEAASPTLSAGTVSGLPGAVTDESASLENGVVSGQVDLTRLGMVMLKTSFDPRWTVTVDGQELPTQMVAPSFVGREVPEGHHEIVFTYQPFPRYDLLFALGVLVFLGLLFGPRWWERWGRDQQREPATEETEWK
jgi:hypothetical protein